MSIAQNRIKGVILRYLYLLIHELYRIVEMIYWPLYDVLFWGFTAVWMQEGTQQLVLTKVVVGMTLWQTFYRNNMEISTSIHEEISERNMVNLFSSPLQLSEWVTGLITLAFCKSTLITLLCAAGIFTIFNVNLFFAGFDSIIWILLLTVDGWTTGLLSSCLLILFGRALMNFIWIIAWIWAPLSGALFPVSILPRFLQAIARCLPMSYVFEDMRNVVTTERTTYAPLMKSALLTCLYFILVLFVFRWSFEKTKNKGLAQLS